MDNVEIQDERVSETEMMESALAYARIGYKVFPLHSPHANGECSCGKADCDRVGKHPRTSGWKDKATIDENTIERWWTDYPDANIGILTGEKSGIVVLDCDDKKGGNYSLAMLVKLFPEIRQAPYCTTGNGVHLYFAHSGVNFPNKQGFLIGLDVRGDGGYVVGPPSRHRNGKKYKWNEGCVPNRDQLPEMSEALREFIMKPIKVGSNKEIKEGTRNGSLFRIGRALRGRGMKYEEILKALIQINEKHCIPPLAESEVEKIARSASKYEANAETEQEKGASSIGSQEIILLAMENCTFFHSPDSVGYAGVMINNRKLIIPLYSKEFREYLGKLCYDKFNRPAKSQPLIDAIGVLNAKARYDFEERVVYSRIGIYQDMIYIDLCNEARQVVQITGTGWDVIENAPIYFQNSKTAKPLPRPVKGGSIDDLRRFINVRDDDQWILAVSWLIKALIPSGAFPILTIQGEQGSAKSTTAEIMKSLVDPTKAPLRSIPRTTQDIYISAVHSWVLGYDNLSGIQPWISDVFCSLATGGGFSVRALYSDNEEVIFEAQRPIILNGIDDLTTRNDLADRSILLYLPAIPKGKRKEKVRILEEFEQIKPSILGALYDAVSTALREFRKVQLKELPRMADFARWIVAAESALPWAKGNFMDAYEKNRDEALKICLEVDILASMVLGLMESKKQWEGSATQLLDALKEFDPDNSTNRAFPKAANVLKGRLRRIAPSLRAEGINIDEIKKHGKKVLRLEIKK